MKAARWGIIISLFLVSCGGNDELDLPEGVAHPDQMTEVLTDVHILEAYLSYEAKGRQDTVIDTPDFREQLYRKALQKHKMDSAKFHKSLQFYNREAPLLQEIYDEVVENLSRIEGERRVEEEPEED